MGVDARMFVRTRRALAPRQVRRLAVRLAETFGHDTFMIWEADALYKGCAEAHALEIVGVWEQDGPDLVPAEGEQFIECNLSGRYYGVGYERGHFPTIYMVACWLEAIVPGAEVWYGGDSSGVLAEPFGPKERQSLMDHYFQHGHSPYARAFGRNDASTPVCGFCDNQAMVNHGGGQGSEFYSCHGCGKNAIRRGDTVHVLNRREDFFAGSQRLKEEGK